MKIRYENTLEDIVAFNCYHLMCSPAGQAQRARLRFLLFWLCLLLLPLGVLALVFAQDLDPSIGPFGLLCLIVAIVGLVYSWQLPRIMNMSFATQARNLIRKGANKNVICMHELELTSDSLIERTPFGQNTLALESLERVEATDRYAFIYQSALAAKVIPRDKVSDGDYEAFVNAIRHRLAERRS